VPPFVPTNNIGLSGYPASNSSSLYGQTSPRPYVGPQPTTVNQSYATGSIPLGKYPTQEYQRISQPNNNQIIPNTGQNTFVLSQNSQSMHNNLNFQNTYMTPTTLRSTNPVITPTNQELAINITPLRPSIIELNRPARNIFPKDTYITKTKFDENLIIVV
jgi:hypothetical protein